jgi:hypothetical protein
MSTLSSNTRVSKKEPLKFKTETTVCRYWHSQSSAWLECAVHGKWYVMLVILRKSVEKIQMLLKFDENNGYLTWRRFHIYDSIVADFFLEWEMFQIKVVNKIKTRFYFQLLSSENHVVYETVSKHMVEPDNMAHARGLLDN